jgi:hypothetical protein
MSYIDCSTSNRDAPCGCDCGHLSSQHRIYTRWLARCLVPECICERLDACEHVQPYSVPDVEQSDVEMLSAIGIRPPE